MTGHEGRSLEDEKISKIMRIVGGGAKYDSSEVWIGDDAAVISSTGPDQLIVSTDSVVQGVHFDLDFFGLDDVGWKALSAAASDMAAMAVAPHRALVAVTAPAGADIDLLYLGISQAAKQLSCPVVGGDLSQSPANYPVLVLTVTVLGWAGGKRTILRSGARPGDVIYLTRPLGASAAGLEHLLKGGDPEAPIARPHLRPIARIAEGIAAAAGGATAMMDISDGFGLDLHRLADASEIGFEIDEIPIADGATFEQAAGGGEDYELLFTAPDPQALVESFRSAGLDTPILVGRCVQPGTRKLKGNSDLPATGWQHRF